jgi:prolyl-tRNA editing enzyme YbaK/EbsC (Cys-tRNA(Pro) deacylase)
MSRTLSAGWRSPVPYVIGRGNRTPLDSEAMSDAAHPANERVRAYAQQRGVNIEITAFDESTHTAQEAADAIGVALGQIVKSLVFMAPVDPAADDKGLQPVVALVRGTDRVDISKLASVSGHPRLRRASAKEAKRATGYTIGGVPPFAHDQQAIVVMDPALDGYEEIWAAAGTPTTVFPVAPGTLAMLADALVAPCAEDVPADLPR